METSSHVRKFLCTFFVRNLILFGRKFKIEQASGRSWMVTLTSYGKGPFLVSVFGTRAVTDRLCDVEFIVGDEIRHSTPHAFCVRLLYLLSSLQPQI